jgi:WD40 repeat protein
MAGELAADLHRYLAREPVQARPTGPPSRFVRWGRRNPVAAASLGAVLLMGLVALVAILGEWRETVDARRQAERNGAAERWERYRSNIAAAAAALELQHGDTARRALEEAPTEHCGWEWRHLHNQLDVARTVIPGAAPTAGLLWRRPILSPSGDRLAAVDSDSRIIKIWEVMTGTAIAVLRGHDGTVLALDYSPDGQVLASGSADGTVRLWQTASGGEIGVLVGHQKPVEWVFYSPDGRRICSMDGESIRLWDAGTHRAMGVVGAHRRGFDALFTPDGRRLVVGLDCRVCLFDATTGREDGVLGRHDLRVIVLAVSPDGERIVSQGDKENTLRLWDGITGREVAVLRGHSTIPGVLTFSPDGSRLATGSPHPESAVRLWEATSGRLIAVMNGHSNGIQSIQFSRDGRRIISTSLDKTARLWGGVKGDLVAILRGHTERL